MSRPRKTVFVAGPPPWTDPAAPATPSTAGPAPEPEATAPTPSPEPETPTDPVAPVFLPEEPEITSDPVAPVFLPDEPETTSDPVAPVFLPDETETTSDPVAPVFLPDETETTSDPVAPVFSPEPEPAPESRPTTPSIANNNAVPAPPSVANSYSAPAPPASPSEAAASASTPARPPRRVTPRLGSALAFIALFFFALIIGYIIGEIFFGDPPEGSIRYILATLIIPEACAIGALIVVAGWLRWPDILRENNDLRLNRSGWLWLVPAVQAIAVSLMLLFTPWQYWPALGVMALLVGCLLVGWAEELLCRGYLLVGARTRMSEAKACFLSCFIFGFIHFFNLLGQAVGATAIQATHAFFAGVGLYLMRRLSGGLLLPILMHGLWDFAIFSQDSPLSPTHSSTGVDWVAVLFIAFELFFNTTALIIVLRKR